MLKLLLLLPGKLGEGTRRGGKPGHYGKAQQHRRRTLNLHWAGG